MNENPADIGSTCQTAEKIPSVRPDSGKWKRCRVTGARSDTKVYDRLMAATSGVDPADRHVLASVVAVARAEAGRPLTEAVGLDRTALSHLLDAAFPNAFAVDELAAPDADAGPDAIEEPDYRALLLEGGAGFAGHIHVHIVPRWLGDTNFMPAVSNTKIISDSLDAMYKLYRKK